MSGRKPYRPTNGSRGFLVVVLCVFGSFALHGVAYAVLQAIRKPKEKKKKDDEIIQRQKSPPKLRKVRLLQPMLPPPPRVTPMRPPERTQNRTRIVRKLRPMEPPPREEPRTPPMRAEPLNLTGAGVSASLTSNNGEGTVHVGSTAYGDPTVDPMRPRPRPMRSEPMLPPPVRRAPAVVYVKRLPQVIQVPKPVYPRRARREQIEGTVKLRVTIGKDGTVLSVSVIKSLGYGLDEAAVWAIRKARFRPAYGSDGRPMRHTITYKFRFQIE
ncbi:MAG: energy transducer TonB [bacterium]